jgi:exosortase
MTTAVKPAYEVVRSRDWIAAAIVLVVALTFAYAKLLAYSFHEWLKPDYSHGFLVPLFSAYLIYLWWPEAPRKIRWPNPWGLAFLAGGMAIFAYEERVNLGKEWFQGLSLVIDLCGTVVLLGGWSALKWCWPAIAFLMFMFPLPHSVEHRLGAELQVLAARCSEFVLQTVGYATYRDGVILHVKDQTLEVQNACNGLSMLLTFVALSVGMAMLITRPWLDRAIILVAAIPVAILANVIRISLTGVLYNEGGKELGDRLFHDFAGWMMMPFALLVLWLLLKLLDWVLVSDLGKASREEVIRGNAVNPAHLFMHAIPGATEKTRPAPPPAKPTPPAPGAKR